MPEAHDLFRVTHQGGGTYADFQIALERYPDFVRPCGVMATVTRPTQSRLLEAVRHFRDLGMSSWDWSLFQLSALAPPGRPVVVFGEEMGEVGGGPLARPDIVTGLAQQAVPRISEALEQRGFFCTYADFVYDGRGAQPVELFGTRRPISSGFLKLAAQDETMLLLPLVALRRGEMISVQFEEPLQISLTEELAADPRAARQLVAPVVAHALETMIARASEQWLLLPYARRSVRSGLLGSGSPQVSPL